MRLDDLSLGLLEQERVEVILHRGEVRARDVTDGRKENRRLGVSAGNDARITGGQGLIPQLEEGCTHSREQRDTER